MAFVDFRFRMSQLIREKKAPWGKSRIMIEERPCYFPFLHEIMVCQKEKRPFRNVLALFHMKLKGHSKD
jgi:hypothetical protein